MNPERQSLASTLNDLSDPPTTIELARASKTLAGINENATGLKSVSLAITSSFTFEPLIRALNVRGYVDGFRITASCAPYGQYMQALMNRQSGLIAAKPDVVLLAIRLQDACPALYEQFNALDADSISTITTNWKNDFRQALASFRQHSKARILCCNYEQPAFPSMGLADGHAATSQSTTIAAMNQFLTEIATEVGDFHLVDIDALASRCGRDKWQDPKLLYWGRIPIAAEHQWSYVGEIVRMIRATSGKAKKVLALDCDNSLWGGVLGDVGRDGIDLGHDYPGNAFVALQKRALELYHRGVVLVVASKNERSAVLDVFENHPEMVLRPEHISYFAVNWDPKPQNLQEVAKTLNLGLDSFVFLDDHPVECAMMREMAPEVRVVNLPKDPAHYERALARLDCFDQLTVSDEDRRRGEMYRKEAARAEFRSEAGSLESFYEGLQMRMTINRNEEPAVARAAQLTQRTNQFNMTTRRRTESEILELMHSEDSDVFTVRLVDRFGDNGIVGLAITRQKNYNAELDTYLMSCRVLGRAVENAFLAWIGQHLKESGCRQLDGPFIPTVKNKAFAGFFKSWGMAMTNRSEDGEELWTCDLEAADAPLTIPSWIQLEHKS